VPLLTCVLALAVAGPARASDPSIVNGQATTISAWPWQVALVHSGGGSAFDRQFCGGSLIAPTIVLTAAHCVYNENSDTFVSPSSLNVVTGRTNLSSGSGQEIHVAQIHVLRNGSNQVLYNPNASTYDVELLQLASPSSSTPIKLAGADEGALWSGGRTAFVTGWGSTVPSSGGYPDGLRMAQVAIVPDSTCQNTLGGLFSATTMVCAGGQSGRDTCDGDSGGPLVVPMAAGGYRLVGDTSFGLNENCGVHASAYGRVGADPLRSLIRNKVLQVAGVDVVGSGGKPPGGGGGTTLTAQQALDAAWAYSKSECISDRLCRKYWAGGCVAQGAAYVCQVRNYEKKRRRKATCRRTVSVSAASGAITTTPVGSWTCRRGWQRSAARSLG